tara:strand:+ start:8263 stop:9015 length:753 start_codon:yes stop_codon:yes gene_type:complete
MKIEQAAIITMRTSSSRLPKKSVTNITNTQKSIDIIIERAKLTNLPVILATSIDDSDNQLVEIAKKHDIHIFRGSLMNKIKRWKDCFQNYEIENALLIDGDDLCYDYNIAKISIQKLISTKSDIIWCPDEIITGLFTLAITKHAIKKLYLCEPNENSDTDIFTHLFKKTNLKISYVQLKNHQKNKEIRLTLDYERDLLFFRELYKHMPITESSDNIIKYILENPKIASINYQCQKDFLENKKLKIGENID